MKKREDPVLQIARELMAAGDPAGLLQRLATLVREAIEADWAAIWIYEKRRRKYSLELSFPEGPAAPFTKKAGRKGDLLHEVVSRKGLVARRAEEIEEPLLQHIESSRQPLVREIFCVPFTLDSDRVGLLELIRERPTPSGARLGQVRFLTSVAALASSAAASMVRLQAGRESQMAAINRLMQLYDVSQVFHSTLERDELLPIIANRLTLIMEAPFLRIWLPPEGEGGGEAKSEVKGEGAGEGKSEGGGEGKSEGESEGGEEGGKEGGGEGEIGALICVFPEVEEEEPERLEAGNSVPWSAFQGGESILVPDLAQDEEAEQLCEFYDADEVGSVICVPLIADETSLGAIEVIRPPGEPPFNEDDRDFLEELTRQASIAIRNANLLIAERKAHELDALLDISREITSTLDLDRVLATIVNRADAIVLSERCAILLAEGNKLEVRAVSGHVEVNRKDKGILDLESILSWAYMSGQSLYISEMEGHIETDREETREKFRRYFERSGMKTFVVYPLKDGEGLLGMISIESSEPYFVPEDKLEAFNILANQATVAIRNATLYHQIPLINIMEPIAGLRARIKKVPRWKWLRNAAYAAAVVVALVLVPWNMKIGGRVVVLPAKNSAITTEIEGVVDGVHYREGDLVRRGDLLANLVDRDQRIRMEEARSLKEIADREVAQYEAALDQVAASQARTRRDQLREEYAILRQELDKTRIVSPVDGVILTPRLERKVGTFLDRGDTFCRVADMSDVAVEILVPETEIAEIEEGQRIRLKIDSFPTETFPARVDIIGQKVTEEEGGRYIVVRGRVDGNDLPLRTGMVGRAKIVVGKRSIGYVILRKPARFIWRTLWTWAP